MEVEDVVEVVQGWKGVYREEGEMLSGSGEDGYVQIFEVSLSYAGKSCHMQIGDAAVLQHGKERLSRAG